MSDPKRRRGCLSRVGITAVIFLTLVLSVLALAYASTDLGSAASSYEKNRDAAKKAGLYFTTEEANTRFNVPEDENAYDLLAAIDTKPLGVVEDLTDNEIRSQKSELVAVCAKFEEASQRKHLLAKKHDLFVDFPTSAKLKVGVKALCRMAKFCSENNDPMTCRDYLLSAARLANLADDGGDAIPVLIRVACAAIVEARLRRILPAHMNDPVWLTVIEDTVKELDQPYDILTMLKLDHRQHLGYVETIMKEPMTLEQIRKGTDFPLSMRLGYYLPRYKEASLSRVHEYYSSLVSLLPQDSYDWEGMKRADKYDSEFQKRKGWSYEAMFEPTFVGLRVWKEISARNALFQAVAMLKSHADPAKGLPLPGRYRMDMDGQPLRVKHLQNGWIVYSLFDGVDDGGIRIASGKGDELVHLSLATAPVEPKPRGQKAALSGRAGFPAGP